MGWVNITLNVIRKSVPTATVTEVLDCTEAVGVSGFDLATWVQKFKALPNSTERFLLARHPFEVVFRNKFKIYEANRRDENEIS